MSAAFRALTMVLGVLGAVGAVFGTILLNGADEHIVTRVCGIAMALAVITNQNSNRRSIGPVVLRSEFVGVVGLVAAGALAYLIYFAPDTTTWKKIGVACAALVLTTCLIATKLFKLR